MRSTRPGVWMPHSFVAVSVMLLSGAGCSGRPLASSWLSREAVVLDLPVIKNSDLYQCGLSCMTVLASYYGMDLPGDLAQQSSAMAKERRGLSGSELQSFLQQMGFDVFVFQGTLDDTPTGLFYHLAKGRPLVVMTSYDGEQYHYEVVMGFDEHKHNMLLLDPAKGVVIVPQSRFITGWEIAGRFTLLAVPGSVTATLNKRPYPV